MHLKRSIFTLTCLLSLPCFLLSCDGDSDEPEGCKTPGFVSCGGICIDPMTSDTYCGANTYCEGFSICAANHLVCRSGKCVDPNTTPDPGTPSTPPNPNACLTFVDQAQAYALVWWDTDHNNCITPQEADAVTEIPYQAFKKNPNVTTLNALILSPLALPTSSASMVIFSNGYATSSKPAV